MDASLDNAVFRLPPTLLEQLQAVADVEERPVADVVREILEQGLRDRRWRRTLVYGQARASVLGLTEADVPRLIAEVRRERRDLAERAARAVPGDFGRILAKAGTPVAIPGDELPDSWSMTNPAP